MSEQVLGYDLLDRGIALLGNERMPAKRDQFRREE
jgi:hypothetical protein